MIPKLHTIERLHQYWRERTAPLRSLPDFNIIGAQKCGTSTLFYLLAEHPQVSAAQVKEVHYFDKNFGRGEAWYRSHFPLRSGRKKATGEATPYYLFHPLVPARIQGLVPSVKLLILLRNPIDRAYSHYHHNRKKGFEPLSFAQAIEQEPTRLEGEHDRMIRDPFYSSFAHQHYSYVQRGQYQEQLQRYLQYFSRSQLLVLKSETLFEKPKKVWDRTLDFLELEKVPVPNHRAWNTGDYAALDGRIRTRLEEHFRPWNRRLTEDWGSHFDWTTDHGRRRPHPPTQSE